MKIQPTITIILTMAAAAMCARADAQVLYKGEAAKWQVLNDGVTSQTLRPGEVATLGEIAVDLEELEETLLEAIPTELSDLEDAQITSPQTGQPLVYRQDQERFTNGTPVAPTSGGTGLESVAVGELLYGSGSNTYGKLAAGTSGYVLKANGAAAPSWLNLFGTANTWSAAQAMAAGSTVDGKAIALLDFYDEDLEAWELYENATPFRVDVTATEPAINAIQRSSGGAINGYGYGTSMGVSGASFGGFGVIGQSQFGGVGVVGLSSTGGGWGDLFRGIGAGSQVFAVARDGTIKTSATLTVAGGSPADGKVWTATDSAGNGNWETPAGHDAVTLAGTPDYITISGQVITRALINLASHVTGTLPPGNGGTGSTATPAAGAVQFGNGSIITQDAANLFFDDSNNWLGIGTNAPATTMDNAGSFRAKGSSSPASGIGLEMRWGSNFGDILAIDRGGAPSAQSLRLFGTNGGTVDLRVTAGSGLLVDATRQVFAPGIIDDDVTADPIPMFFHGTTGQLGYDSSARVLPNGELNKENERDATPEDTAKLTELAVTVYDRAGEDGRKGEIGLIAEDVAAVFPAAVFYRTVTTTDTQTGKAVIERKPMGVNYNRIVPLLIARVQDQEKRLADMEARLVALERRSIR